VLHLPRLLVDLGLALHMQCSTAATRDS
jgi:hypothetical protein